MARRVLPTVKHNIRIQILQRKQTRVVKEEVAIQNMKDSLYNIQMQISHNAECVLIEI